MLISQNPSNYKFSLVDLKEAIANEQWEKVQELIDADHKNIMLSEAISANLKTIVEVILSRSKQNPLCIQTLNGRSTLLHKSMSYPEIFKLLVKKRIEQGQSIHPLDSDEFTPLHLAIANDDLSLVTFITDSSSSESYEAVNPPGYLTKTPLHIAMNDRRKIALILFEKINSIKGEFNIPDCNGVTPLHLAAGHNFLEPYIKFVNKLQAQNKEINLKTKDGVTPYMTAMLNGHSDIIKHAIQCFIASNQPKEINPVLEEGFHIIPGETVLHRLAEEGTLILADIILAGLKDTNENVNPKDSEDNTVLHIAVMNGRFNFCEKLLNTIPTTEENLRLYNKQGKLPIHYAYKDFPHIVKLFLKTYKEANLLSCFSKLEPNPYAQAARFRNIDVLSYFLINDAIDKTQPINFTVGEQSVFKFIFASERNDLIKIMVKIMVDQWAAAIFPNSERYLQWNDICLGLAYTQDRETLLVQLTKLHDTYGVTEAIKYFKIAFKNIAEFGDPKQAFQLIDLSKAKLGIRKTAELLKSVTKKKLKNQQSNIVDTFNEFIKNHNAFSEHVNNKIFILESWLEVLPENVVVLPENESAFSTINSSYQTLNSQVKHALSALQAIEDKAAFEALWATLYPPLSIFAQTYKTDFDAFKMQSKALRQNFSDDNQAVLDRVAQLVQTVKSVLASHQMKADRINLLEKGSFSLKAALAQYYFVMENNPDYLCTNMQEALATLSNQVEALTQNLVDFQHKEKQENEVVIFQKNESRRQEIMAKIYKYQDTLNKKIKKLEDYIKKPQSTLCQADWLESLKILQEQQAIYPDAYPDSLADCKVLLSKIMAKREEDQLALKAIFERIEKRNEQNKKQELENRLLEQQERREKLLVKVQAIETLLKPVLEHTLAKTAIKKPTFVYHKECLFYHNFLIKTQSKYLNEANIPLDIQNILRELDEWLTNNQDDIKNLEARLNAKLLEINHAPMSPLVSRPDDENKKKNLPNAAAAVYLPSAASRKRRQKQIPLCPLALHCPDEMQALKKIVLALKQNHDYPVRGKTHILLLFVAMLFEGIKTQLTTQDPRIKIATDIRNAIFHQLQEKDITDEKFEALLNWADNIRDRWNEPSLETFLNELPLIQSTFDEKPLLNQIDTHITCLAEFIEKIEKGSFDLNKKILDQAEIASRMAQLDRLLKDLNHKSKHNINLQMAYGARIFRIKSKLKMYHFQQLRSAANAIRHDGNETILQTANDLYLHLALSLSEQEPQPGPAADIDESTLASLVGKLTL